MPTGRWNRDTPSAAVQVRQRLEVTRRQGIPFLTAWNFAIENAIWQHDSNWRWAEKDAMEATKGAFCCAYHGHHVQGGEAALALRGALEGERHDPNHVRDEPARFSTNPGRVDSSFHVGGLKKAS